MSLLELRDVSKSFATPNGPLAVLEKVSLVVERGRFVTFFGPNGCGKTTLMNIIAGLDTPDSGSLVRNMKSGDEAALVFQDYRSSLLPWLNVKNNILFPLLIRNVPLAEQNKRIEKLLSQLDLSVDLNAKVYHLSGGQAQTVCLLRGLIIEPEMLILDEPFSSLDYQTTQMMHEKILDIWSRLGITILFISHDLDEALYLADETIFLHSRPTRVVEVLPSPLGRPRPVSLIASREFADLKGHALSAFAKCLAHENTKGHSDEERAIKID